MEVLLHGLYDFDKASVEQAVDFIVAADDLLVDGVAEDAFCSLLFANF